jgi:hypothetical protein
LFEHFISYLLGVFFVRVYDNEVKQLQESESQLFKIGDTLSDIFGPGAVFNSFNRILPACLPLSSEHVIMFSRDRPVSLFGGICSLSHWLFYHAI